MRQLIINQDILLDIDKILIKKLWKVKKDLCFPTALEFSYQYLYFKSDEWIQIARIDNQLHKGKPGTHIHILNRKVRWEKLTFEESEKRIIELSKKIISKILQGENNEN